MIITNNTHDNSSNSPPAPARSALVGSRRRSPDVSFNVELQTCERQESLQSIADLCLDVELKQL